MYLYDNQLIKPLFGNSFPWEDNKNKPEEVDIEALKKEAYLKGHEEGYKKGVYEAEKKANAIIEQLKEKHKEELKSLLNQTIKKLSHVIDKIAGLRKELISKADKDILEIALLVARKIIKAEISQNKELILNNIREALNSAVDKDNIIIKVAPEDYKFLSGIKDLKELLEVKKVILQEDESVSAGGCIVKTKYSEIDARIESQLQQIEKCIKEQG